jgi:hypothetical protein
MFAKDFCLHRDDANSENTGTGNRPYQSASWNTALLGRSGVMAMAPTVLRIPGRSTGHTDRCPNEKAFAK